MPSKRDCVLWELWLVRACLLWSRCCLEEQLVSRDWKCPHLGSGESRGHPRCRKGPWIGSFFLGTSRAKISPPCSVCDRLSCWDPWDKLSSTFPTSQHMHAHLFPYFFLLIVTSDFPLPSLQWTLGERMRKAEAFISLWLPHWLGNSFLAELSLGLPWEPCLLLKRFKCWLCLLLTLSSTSCPPRFFSFLCCLNFSEISLNRHLT